MIKRLLLVFLLFCESCISAELLTVTVSKPAPKKIRFDLKWNAPPDFFTLDQYNRQADSFSFFIHPVYTTNIIGTVSWNDIPWTAIVRGVEEKSTSNVIVIRTKIPAVKPPEDFRLKRVSHYNPPPNLPVTSRVYSLWTPSGGWGDVVGKYPYTTNTGTNTIFEVDTNALGITNRFSMYITACKYGASYKDIVQLVNIVP